MGLTVKNPQAIVNEVRENLSPSLREAIPQANENNISEIATPLLQWSDVANVFYTSLINLIGMQYVEYRSYKNPLNMFKRGTSQFGDTIQEIAVNFMPEKDYDITGQDLLKNSKPDIKACYYRINRQKKFDVTNIESELRMAFTSWENFGNLLSRIVDNLYRSNEACEYNWAKETISSAINENKIFSVETPAPTDSASANNVAKLIKQYSRLFTFPSTKYNVYNNIKTDGTDLITFTPKEEQTLILTPESEASMDVDSLAVAFNMDKVEFMGKVIVVDSLPLNYHALLCDSAFVRIWENVKYFNTFINPDNMSAKHYLHVWQTYGYSPFCNVVGFTSQLPTPDPEEPDEPDEPTES